MASHARSERLVAAPARLSRARVASRGAYACAAGLAAGTLLATLVTDVSVVAARPGIVPADAPPALLASLATLPGPSPILLAGLLPAAALLISGRLLALRDRSPEARFGSGAATGSAGPVHPLRLAAGRLSDLAFAVFVAAILALSVLPGLVELTGARLVAITSGSMAPAYPSGAMTLVWPAAASSLVTGDVILFRDADGRMLTHRIAEVRPTAEGLVFVMRGDAAPEADAALVPAAAVVGRVEGSLPWLGALRAWVFAPAGIFAALLVGLILARGTATRRS